MNAIPVLAMAVVFLGGPVLAQQATDTTSIPAGSDAPGATDAPVTKVPGTAESAAPTVAPSAGKGAATGSDEPAGPSGFDYAPAAQDISARTFIGKRLYATPTPPEKGATVTKADASWKDVGEIDDLVIDSEGRVKAVLVDVGGFLGLGEKTVAVALEQLRVIGDRDTSNDYFIVFTADRTAIEQARAFEWPDAD